MSDSKMNILHLSLQRICLLYKTSLPYTRGSPQTEAFVPQVAT